MQVVISSAWRERNDLTALRHLCGPLLGARIVWVTPVCQRPIRDRSQPIWRERFQEIAAWLWTNAEAHVVAEVDPTQQAERATARHDWIAVDDVPSLFPANCPQLLVTNEYGLTAKTLLLLMDRLKAMS